MRLSGSDDGGKSELALMITSKAANGYQFKTGQWKTTRT